MQFRLLLSKSISSDLDTINMSGTIHTDTRVCNHVIAVYSGNKLQQYATAYRNHKSAGEKLCLVSNLYFSSKPG